MTRKKQIIKHYISRKDLICYELNPQFDTREFISQLVSKLGLQEENYEIDEELKRNEKKGIEIYTSDETDIIINYVYDKIFLNIRTLDKNKIGNIIFELIKQFEEE